MVNFRVSNLVNKQHLYKRDLATTEYTGHSETSDLRRNHKEYQQPVQELRLDDSQFKA